MIKINENSIDFLDRSQSRNGSFSSYTSIYSDNLDGAYLCESVFSTALVILCLSTLNETPVIKKIKRKAIYFLLTQKTEHWTFNYWDRRSKDYLKMPYPDDLDDTSCALAAMYSYNNKLIDGDVMAKFVTILTHLEIKEGGPYKSWITNPESEKVWHDVDLAVNANIAYFLSMLDVRLDGLNELIDNAILKEGYTSPYYTSPYPIIYFISRSYTGEFGNKIVNYLLGKKNSAGNWGNPLFSALSLTSLANLGHSIKDEAKCVEYIISKSDNGALPFQTFYLGINPNGDEYKHHSGSEALSTAICLEAMEKYKKSAEKITGVHAKKNDDEKFIRSEILKNTNVIISKFDIASQKKVNAVLKKNLKTDNLQPILLLPYLFMKMLQARDQINNNQLVTLGGINLMGWVAYTIYDNIIDGDDGVCELSVANTLMRDVNRKIIDLTRNNPDFKNYFFDILDRIDIANSWEVNNCRLLVSGDTLNLRNVVWPDYGELNILADRSMGHAIGPITVLMILGFCTEFSDVCNLVHFFRHYIIARQLNDDAHDWESDLKNGQLTIATIDVLKIFKNKKVNTEKDLPVLQQIFWHKTVTSICSLSVEHANKAEEYLHAINSIKDYSLFKKILSDVKSSSEKALKERKKALEFLDTYKKLEDK